MFQTVINAFQSTPPRGGRPVPLGPVIAITDISIHAPARGATDRIGNRDVWRADFNPRPREGGDVPAAPTPSCTTNFNPRPREGGDRQRRPAHSGKRISIHAPARGATDDPKGDAVDLYISIHAPARGATVAGQRRRVRRRISIHAPARGATSRRTSSRSAFGYFNPRPREGGDDRRRAQRVRPPISIHAPARGATVVGVVLALVDGISIHAPARGATRTRPPNGTKRIFQSTPPRGGRPYAGKSLGEKISHFNPRPREGGDLLPDGAAIVAHLFQSTPPRGGRR